MTHTAVGNAAHAASESRVPVNRSAAENVSVEKPDVVPGAAACAGPISKASVESARMNTHAN